MLKNTKVRKSPIRVVKRANITWKQSVILYLISILGALFIGGIFIGMVGKNPILFYIEVFSGCFRNKIYFIGLIRITMPLVITSLGISISFKMRFWNIGAEGQFIMGALGATIIGLFVGGLSHFAMIMFMAIGGIVFAGLYALIPALLKVKFGTNETLLTLMFNYIAFYIISYLQKAEGFRNPESGFPVIKKLPQNAFLDQLFGIDITWIVCILLTVLLFIYLNHTKQGYEISVVGESQATARYAGMNVKKIIIRTMFLSGGIVGLAGMLHASGIATSHQLSTGITGGVGWTGIIVAWLARLNPFGILLVSILMGILKKGSGVAQSTMNVSSAVSDILMGVILFSVLGFDFFTRYKLSFSKLIDDKTTKDNENDDINADKKEDILSTENELSAESEVKKQNLYVKVISLYIKVFKKIYYMKMKILKKLVAKLKSFVQAIREKLKMKKSKSDNNGEGEK